MRLIGKEKHGDAINLIVEEDKKRFLLKPKIKIRKFMSLERIAGDFFCWLELPDKTIVPDHLSFQLDAWNKYLEGKSKALSTKDLN